MSRPSKVGLNYASIALVVLFQILILLLSQSVHAGSVSFWPTRVDLTPAKNIEQVSVTNDSDEAAFIQAAVFDWEASESDETPSPTPDIIAVPAIFDLEPGDTQIVRLSFRDPASTDTEQAYRLQIMEVPKTTGLLPNTAVIAFRVVLPVFFSPNGTSPTADWALRQEPLKAPELVIENSGTAHINVDSVEVFAESGAGPRFLSEDGDIVLPGGEKTWTLDNEFASMKVPLRVKAKTNIGLIESSVSFSGG